jgi:predicted nucleotidyltransferase
MKYWFFGSYAHGNWGVGIDLDIVIIIEASPKLTLAEL